MKQIIKELKFFRPFKDITKEDVLKTHKYNQAFFINRIYPRFFQSYLYLRSERRYFFYGFIDNCFILLKKYKQFNNFIVYLVLPPISLDGKLKQELNLIKKMSNLGIKTRVSDEDIKLYGLSKKEYVKNKDDIEMIYSYDTYNNFKGKKIKNFKYARNLLNKLKNEKLIITTKDKLNNADIEKNNLLLKNWSLKKREDNIKSKGDMCHKYFNEINFCKYIEFGINDDILIASIFEEINKDKIILDTNYLNYSINIKGFDAALAMHIYLMENISRKAFVNSGSGGFDKGLTAHKRRLKPCKELQIYNTNISGKITENEYNIICTGV